MKLFVGALLSLLLAGIGTLLFAHDGHGVTSSATMLHYLAEPIHVLAIFAPILMVAAVIWVMRRRQAVKLK